MSTNQYTRSMSLWYDRIMAAGYYNHALLFNSLSNVLKGKHSLLELGVGTGLFAEELVRHGYSVTGVDFTQEMLKEARKRLGDKVTLIKGDLVTLKLPRNFDAAICQGGVWYMAHTSKRDYLESHIPNIRDNIRAMRNVYNSLTKNGLLIVAIQPAHASLDGLSLGNSVIYSQQVTYKGSKIHKEYFIRDGSRLVAHQNLTFRRFSSKELQELLKKSGFKDMGNEKTNSFRIFQKMD